METKKPWRKLATNRQLWRLNEAGLLRIVDSAPEITVDEATQALDALRANGELTTELHRLYKGNPGADVAAIDAHAEVTDAAREASNHSSSPHDMAQPSQNEEQ